VVRWRDARKEGKTFDVVAEAASKHAVPHHGHGFEDRSLDHTGGISANSGLGEAGENGGFHMQTDGSHLIIDELLCGVIFL
jgi:hypothetical protein